MEFGVIGTLVFWIGMTLSIETDKGFFWHGVVIGLCGLVILVITYPVYRRMVLKRREKIKDEIIRLTDELRK